MADYAAIEEKIRQVLGSEARPIAITFAEAAPEGVEAIAASEPASCSYWKLAASGRTFYTLAKDHWDCPLGGYTHRMLDSRTMPSLMRALTAMDECGYLKMGEITRVFQVPETLEAVIYAPLGQTPCEPSVVLVCGKPGRMAMLCEAARRAGTLAELPLLGSPTCMALGAAMAEGTVASAGGVGSRMYTGLGDDEIYVALRGCDLESIAAELDLVLAAERAMTEYFEERP
jgi:uncharacterized protein (DUF169 family)